MNWSVADFVVAGTILLTAGALFWLIVKKTRSTKSRIVSCLNSCTSNSASMGGASGRIVQFTIRRFVVGELHFKIMLRQ
jgi:hypothetical protein